ncbi:OPT/YSL family transporter [Myxococcota bacterium]|nr:OPT/YSL family transporter [Myxococcota bacterium]
MPDRRPPHSPKVATASSRAPGPPPRPAPLFQRPPSTPDEVERSRPLAIPPDQVLEMTEEEWYARIYRGEDVPQLTVRAVLMGSALGFLLAFTNLYVGLKTGWGLGVAITACILSYGIWNLLLGIGVAKTPMTILETNCMQSTASAAGYSTGGTMISAIAALLMLSVTPEHPQGQHLPWPVLTAWTVFLAALGTVLAIPMKRNLINKERLKFPSGTAAAVTLQSLYSEGSEAIRKARALAVSGFAGALFPLLIDLQVRKTADGRAPLLPADSPIFDLVGLPARGTHLEGGKAVANEPSHWTMVLDHNPIMIAAGALVGLRVTIYMMLGGLLLVYVAGPVAYESLWTSAATGQEVRAATEPWKAWKEIGLWLGVPIMVSSGLLSFALQWRTIARAFRGLAGGAGGAGGDSDLVRRTEVPMSWFAWGTVIAGAAVVGVAFAFFDVPAHYGVLAVLLTFLLALVACRATGESDITPVGAMGKIMQLTYGVLIPQSTTANLMTAGITASSAGSAADLLNDLKSGYLLGANPRRQFVAQFMGIFAGTAATVTGFYLLVPDATVLTGVGGSAPAFPAPAAQAWKAVAEVFKLGLDNMHPMHRQAIFWGLGLGAAMVALEQLLPKARKWLPSATGLGLGLILPFQYPLSMFLGAVVAHFWSKGSPKTADAYLVPLASGIIAGVSIMGVLVAVLNNFVLAS